MGKFTKKEIEIIKKLISHERLVLDLLPDKDKKDKKIKECTKVINSLCNKFNCEK